MAVAEARAAWQRTVNRCLVQEDAKRAPKLACCPSASPSVREIDVGPRVAADAQDIPSVGFLPYNRNASYMNLSPNSRWWLQLQPSYMNQKGLTNEQLKSAESEMETSQSGVISDFKLPDNDDDGAFVYDSTDTVSFVDSDLRIFTSSVNNVNEVEKQELEPMYKQNPRHFPKLEDPGKSCKVAEMGTDGCAVSKKTNELFPCSESPWIGDEKTEPWWRTADQDELTLLVAQRSFGLIGNCDLPQPQNTRVKGEAVVDLCYFDHDRKCICPVDTKNPGCHHDLIIRSRNTVVSDSEGRQQWLPVDGQLQSSTIVSLRDGTNQEEIFTRTVAESDSSKARLLEALCHSQTRAREAEKAAKQANAEKEHLVKLVFRQASQLFAYKQWFQLLQLENLCYQIRNNTNQPLSTLFPVMLPWVPQKTRNLRKNWQKAVRGRRAKRGRPRCKYTVVFVLGLSLIGAGILFGWTVGWMLPAL